MFDLEIKPFTLLNTDLVSDTISFAHTFFSIYLQLFVCFTVMGLMLFLADEILANQARPEDRVSTKRKLGNLVVLLGLVYWSIYYYFELPLEATPVNLSGRVYAITGCTEGTLGFEMAKTLVEWNGTVVCGMRDAAKGAKAKAAFQNNPKFEVMPLDLTSFASTRVFAKSLLRAHPQLDGLVLNAGFLDHLKRVTEDGFDEMFQVNHLAQYLLTRELLSAGALDKNARVVFLSSMMYMLLGHVDREAYSKKPGLQDVSAFGGLVKDGVRTYADHKLMNILTANELNKRFRARRVNSVANSVCPGLTASEFQTRGAGAMGMLPYLLARVVGRSLKQGASRPLMLLTAPEFANVGGKYFNSYVSQPHFPSQVNEEVEAWLWSTSEKLVGLSS